MPALQRHLPVTARRRGRASAASGASGAGHATGVGAAGAVQASGTQGEPGARAVRGAVVLITGAARGMGLLYARKAVTGGAAHVLLWDVDAAALDAAVQELNGLGAAELHPQALDLSDREALLAAAAAATERFGAVGILVNNAGIVRGKRFWDHDPAADIEATLRVNTLAPMWLTRALLPAMLADTSRERRILNIASAAGTLANPNMSVYAASKWAMLGWSESLRLELGKDGYRHVSVTTFCPSYVSTGMFEGARGPLMTPILSPKAAASAAWEGMLRRTPVVMRPWTVKLGAALRAVLPTRAWDVVGGKVFHVYSSMDKFTGRAGK
jgi:all-trans-retinol dehydrogenase (NAD+)